MTDTRILVYRQVQEARFVSKEDIHSEYWELVLRCKHVIDGYPVSRSLGIPLEVSCPDCEAIAREALDDLI